MKKYSEQKALHSKTKAKPRRVNFAENDADMECLILGELGLSTRFIEQRTGKQLTPGQISYRLHKGGVKRKDYRDGESELVQEVIGSDWIRKRARGAALEASGAKERPESVD